MSGYSFTTPVWEGGKWVVPAISEVRAARRANGPEDRPPDDSVQWDSVRWREQEEQVRRLRQRIFKASQEQDWPRVRNLQKLMLRSRANTLVSVRQVTQRNAGRGTAGIDGEVALTSGARADVAVRVHRSVSSWSPRAVRRVYIPKASNRAKLRPLGIPVLMDRCHQARVRNALEPEWEARFEPRSYGFRPGRGCHDAIEAIFAVCKGRRSQRAWVLDADLAAAFDRIDHSRLLAALGSFPARDMIRDWLKAGVFEEGKGFAPTEEGTPQGGVISPLLLNVAMHGLEEAAGVRYRSAGTHAGETEAGSPVLVRYADDFAVLCHSQRQAQQVQARLAEWLAPRGLAFNEDKTRIVHLSQGFDFLGVTVRRFPTGIDRHVMVKGGASPDDPALASYWASRRRRIKPPLDGYTLRLLTRQDGRCPLCGDPLLAADQPPQSPQQWEQWWLTVARKAIAASYLTHQGRPGPAGQDQTRLVHASCLRGHQARQRTGTAQQTCTP